MAPPLRYDRLSIALHWVIAIGIIGLSCSEMLREQLPRGTLLRDTLKWMHNPLGTLVFGLILLRVIWRFVTPALPHPTGSPRWEHVTAKLMHIALYVAMIVIPVTGIVYTFSRGRAIDFGLLQIDFPLDHLISRANGKTIKSLHEWGGNGILLLALIHAGAGLWHHYARKDDVLIRMLPQRWSGRSKDRVLSP